MYRTFEQLKTDLETAFKEHVETLIAVNEQFTVKFNSFDAELTALPPHQLLEMIHFITYLKSRSMITISAADKTDQTASATVQ